MAFLIAIMAIVVYGHKVLDENPSEITTPVYMESRMIIDVPNTSRELEVIFLGEMVSQQDCTQRSNNYLANLLENCHICQIKSTECKQEIHSRNKKLFSDRKALTTYLGLSIGSRFERDGRLVVWGLNDDEARLVCKSIKDQIGDNYKGTAKCI